MKPKPVVGQTLYSLSLRTRHREQKLTPVKVVKVGRKYFTAIPDDGREWEGQEYHIDNWGEKTNGYSPMTRLFSSVQEYEDSNHKSELLTLLSKEFSHGGAARSLTLETLRDFWRQVEKVKLSDVVVPVTRR